MTTPPEKCGKFFNFCAKWYDLGDSPLPQNCDFQVVSTVIFGQRCVKMEIRGAKASLACRESYGDEAIGYVQLKREKSICTVKCRICPEHKVRSKAYSVTLILDQIEEKILDVNCHDCAAATGGCKDAVALLMWVHRRREDPAPTDIACYWKKSRLSGVGTVLKFVEAKDLRMPCKACLQPSLLPDNSTFLHEVLQVAEANVRYGTR
ncbi:hypothetical protein KPH14_012739 [Odynerus spinipes]|uniref:Uncharacterized protein n=1 Tax=Odynerus spinipes TaxID=1348599 RepID=A0AAD9REX1_9HYME|nr:hypothetical protein KPH14_012739 [Odynerus spinipes]